jgi:hypothetical protein
VALTSLMQTCKLGHKTLSTRVMVLDKQKACDEIVGFVLCEEDDNEERLMIVI